MHESNDEVQKLLEADMGTLEECIRAIERYDTAQVALKHTMQIELGEEVILSDSNTTMHRASEKLTANNSRFVNYVSSLLSIIYIPFLQDCYLFTEC